MGIHRSQELTNQATVSASGSEDITLGQDMRDLRLYLDVTAVPASYVDETLDVDVYAVENSKEYLLQSFTQVTDTAGQESAVVTNCPPNLRVKWAAAGTGPDYDFNVRAGYQADR